MKTETAEALPRPNPDVFLAEATGIETRSAPSTLPGASSPCPENGQKHVKPAAMLTVHRSADDSARSNGFS